MATHPTLEFHLTGVRQEGETWLSTVRIELTVQAIQQG